GAQCAGFNLRRHGLQSRPTSSYATKHCCEFFHVFVPLVTIQPQPGFSAAVLFVLYAVTSDQFDLTVGSAGLLHLPHTAMSSQISLRALSQLAVKSLVMRIEVC